MTYFLSVIIMQIVLFERMEISNVCSHSVHSCKTLWSDSNRADRKDFTNINGAAPADPLSTLGTQDTPARGPIWTFNGRVVVFSARANRVCSELLVESFLSALLESDQSVSQACTECEQTFEISILSNKTICIMLTLKKYVIISFQILLIPKHHQLKFLKKNIMIV